MSMVMAVMRKLLKNLDWVLLLATVILVIVGILLVYSATHMKGDDPWAFVKARLFHLTLGVLAMAFIILIDYHALARQWVLLYVGNLLALLIVLVIGRETQGAQRWISLGFLGTIQPSEFAKVSLIVTLATHLSARRGPYRRLRELVPFLLHAGVPMILIIQQPDLGTALVYLAILFGMLYAAGAEPRPILGVAGVGLALSPVLWHFLKDYQRARLLAFLDPLKDPLGAGYAIIQSKIAIGSGQIFGKGYLHGTQTMLQFVPEHHTDFIFTVVGEELGFVGAVVVLFVFLVWLWRGLAISMEARDTLGMLIAVGVTSMMAFHVFVNVGMTIGLMPITGIPLPFLSHGGSALVTALTATGLLLNVWMRRKKIWF
ncbi:MAG: rod shape-determining protein RodA [Armatimonadota bacterium]|nr:rod shape-determining protein RodA [Armatimonadota bacterium]MDR5702856.1 rod shape-determining protein RodA [Armatimonadota bacterium]MDR7435052.1 rod shape-determining protein RodA [Armatimonadota bacterium]